MPRFTHDRGNNRLTVSALTHDHSAIAVMIETQLARQSHLP